MKCPRCGDVIAGVEHATGQEYADFTCSACDDEIDDLFPGHDIDDDDDICHCDHPDDAGAPECQRCGGDLR